MLRPREHKAARTRAHAPGGPLRRFTRFVLPFELVLTLLGACNEVGGPWPGGIGAVLRFRDTDHTLHVEDVPPDTAAARAGLAAGDEVLAIDDTPVADMGVEEVVRRLRGPVASKVRLTMRRGATIWEVEVEREPYRAHD